MNALAALALLCSLAAAVPQGLPTQYDGACDLATKSCFYIAPGQKGNCICETDCTSQRSPCFYDVSGFCQCT
ncbi:hypothetical protein CLAFUW4_20057 [Fulvia fulva]|nr:hypothetical protein CLAFUR4_20057 [Fulvia fulva]WPV16364.1 hypothetical protein CLAFUW4_20057 [Fulvia fulva]WPV31100.1 hypothetical protein CLAFUW7_20057 [Fulvia fulva]